MSLYPHVRPVRATSVEVCRVTQNFAPVMHCSRLPIPSAQLLENQMKHNQHVMTWLGALRDEASLPGCELGRILEIAAIVARYAFGTGSI